MGFNNTKPNTRGPLEVVHAKTDQQSREELVDAFARAQDGASGHSSAYMVLLENRFQQNEFVVLAEWERGLVLPPPGVATSPQEWEPTRSENFVREASRIADCAHLRFGPRYGPMTGTSTPSRKT